MALAVRRKGKSLKDCMALVLKTAFNAKTQLDDRITKAAVNDILTGLRAERHTSVSYGGRKHRESRFTRSK